LLARSGQWNLPSIRSIITAPTLRVDGSILSDDGYDEQTGIYLDRQGVEFPAIPTNPTKADARDCLDLLIDMVSEVPFVVHEDHGEINRSVYLSALLSGVTRNAIPTAPMHTFTAPVAGSGKSVLVDAIAYAMTGSPAPVMTQGASEEETEKRLASALMAGGAVISFDNCEIPISGELLCQAVTQPILQMRILGQSKSARVSNTACYFATGNNLTIMGDMTRRALRCVIDPQCERPEFREFNTQRPDEAMKSNRAEYVAAALTVMRAYFVAGRPKQAQPLGSLEGWSRTVRDALIWLGEPDPCLSFEEIRVDDPRLENDAALLYQWHEKFGSERKITKDVIEMANAKTESMGGQMPRLINASLRDAIQVATMGKVDSQGLGCWIRKVKNRQIAGYTVKSGGKNHGNLTWYVVQTDGNGKILNDESEESNFRSMFRDEVY
jgi:putative DNA primase/helicase